MVQEVSTQGEHRIIDRRLVPLLADLSELAVSNPMIQIQA
jgi:hypothetical protein